MKNSTTSTRPENVDPDPVECHPSQSGSLASETAATLTYALRGIPFVKTSAIPLRPVILERGRYGEYWRLVRRFTELLERTCWVQAASPAHLNELLGGGSADPDLLTDSPDERRWAACMSRTDAVISGGELKIVECNLGGGIGGVVSMQVLAESYSAIFGAGRQGISVLQPFKARRDLFLQAIRAKNASPSVALLGTMRDPGIGDRRYFDLEVDYLRRCGLEARFLEPEELVGEIGRDETPGISVALRHFIPSDWRAAGIDMTPVHTAWARGVLMLSPETSSLLGNKILLAWMSSGGWWFSSDDHEFCRRHLPWTRVVEDSPVTWRGRNWDLLTLLSTKKDAFVIKSAKGYGGKGVTMGMASTESEWRNTMEHAVRDGNFIVQEYVRPDPIPMTFYDANSGLKLTKSVTPVYGFLLFGGAAAGCLVRHSTFTPVRIINGTQGCAINIAATRNI